MYNQIDAILSTILLITIIVLIYLIHKNRHLFSFKKHVLGPLVVFGLMAAAIGTTYTNYMPLVSKYPVLIALGMSVAITLAFLIPQFLRYLPLPSKFVMFGVIFISSSLAINTVAMKEIHGTGERIVTDESYNRYKQQYNDANRSEIGDRKIYEELLSMGPRYDKAAKEVRSRINIHIANKNLAQIEMNRRAQGLNKVGTVQKEAHVETWSMVAASAPFGILKFMNKEMIQISSNILFSVINDSCLLLFPMLLVGIYGRGILFGDERKKKVPFSFGKKSGKMKMPIENETENYDENDDESMRPDFQKNKGDLTRANAGRKRKYEKLKVKVLQIYERGFHGASEISRILKEDGCEVTPQRISQIKKEMGLR